MPQLTVILDPEQRGFPAIRRFTGRAADIIHLGEDAEIAVGALAGGMDSGEPSVAFCFTLPDGRVVLAETSLRLLLTAADTLRARYGDPRQEHWSSDAS